MIKITDIQSRCIITCSNREEHNRVIELMEEIKAQQIGQQAHWIIAPHILYNPIQEPKKFTQIVNDSFLIKKSKKKSSDVLLIDSTEIE